MDKKELEERVAYLEDLLIRAAAWIGVRPQGMAQREYRKVMREVYDLKHEVESRDSEE